MAALERQLTQTMYLGEGNATAIYLSALTSVTQLKSYCVRAETRQDLFSLDTYLKEAH